MSSSDGLIAKIPILNSHTEYAAWHDELIATAMALELFSTLSGSEEALPTDAKFKIKEARNQHAEKARGLIIKTVSQVICTDLLLNDSGNIVKLEGEAPATFVPASTKTMMAYIADKSGSQTGIAPVLEYQKFIMTLFTDDGTLCAQLDAHLELRNICEANKFKMPDWQYVVQILCALPPSYHTLFDTVLARKGVEDLMPDDVQTKVLDQEAVAHNRVANANVINRGSNLNAQAGPSHKNPPRGPCHYCGKEGHHQKVCKKRKADNKKAVKAKQSNGTPPGGRGGPGSSNLNVVAMEATDAHSNDTWSSYLGATENWLLDSGATDHLMLFRSDFTDYTVYTESHETIILGDGTTTLQSLGRGTVTHWVETEPGKFHKFKLKNMLHVDGIQRCFLSWIKLDNAGFDFQKSGTSVSFTKGNATFKALRRGPQWITYLYSEPPLGSSAQPWLSQVETIPLKLLHEHMGHADWNAMK